MAETYKNSTQFVYLDIYGGGVDAPPTAVCTTPDGTVSNLTVNGDSPDDDASVRFVAILGLAQTQLAGEVRIDWQFTMDGTPVTKTDYFDVVVPLVDFDDARFELDLGDEVSDDRLALAERRARIMIENATGQSFAPTVETVQVYGTGTNVVRLPKRLISIRGVHPNLYTIEKSGWALRQNHPYFDGIVTHSGVPIVDPYSNANKYWGLGRSYNITGLWGWERVPKEITEAALILIEEQLCPDTVYRERYITSMTAADWRIQFNPGAYKGTGNVIVDQILAQFRVSSMAVI